MTSAWDATQPSDWARELGLVPVPMFGRRRAAVPPGKHAVLLDGERGSFAITSVESTNLSFDEGPLSWAWSAHVRHWLGIDSTRGEMFLRRWDEPSSLRRFRLPKSVIGASDLLQQLERAPAPRAPDVICYVLKQFRTLRVQLPDSLIAIATLNLELLAAAAVREGFIDADELRSDRTAHEVILLLGERWTSHVATSALAEMPLRRNWSALLVRDTSTGCILDPDLLLRHASSQLYQEAHYEIEKSAQLTLPGLGAAKVKPKTAPRDVRFTPASLARSLAQQAVAALFAGGRPSSITILDPACGSGVFLQEALRELAHQRYIGLVRIIGYDISVLSQTITDFCVSRCREDLAVELPHVTIEVLCVDALTHAWAQADIILMNPPFVAWDDVSEEERETLRSVLAGRASGRIDKAMAFFWKAVQSVRGGGIVASVLPAALLENRAGLELREAIAETAALLMVGRFDGTSYFRGSLIETSFVVLEKTSNPQRAETRLVYAPGGSEDAALRSLRTGAHVDPISVTLVRRESISATSWMPRSQEALTVRALLADAHTSTVEDVFAVKQGARTGANETFLLGREDYESLPRIERKLFRPAAGSKTIDGGTLQEEQFLFFPYDPAGLTITSEDALSNMAPHYFSRWLLPAKERLAARRSLRGPWWALSEHRNWQAVRKPKLVSAYFGDLGSFAFDYTGEYVVLQGFAWLISARDEEEAALIDEVLNYAYLSLFNTAVFESVLEAYCPRVQGGQFDLSPRYVDKMPLPMLRDESRFRTGLVSELAEQGRRLTRGGSSDADRTRREELAAAAYGLPVPY